MAVIKSADSHLLARSAIVLDLGDIRRQAEDMERHARDKVKSTISEAQRERERILNGAAEEGAAKGYSEGLARGTEEGRAQGREEALAESRPRLDALAGAWESALAKFETERERMLQLARSETMAFAAGVAERVTRRMIEQNPEVVKDVLGAALALTIRPTRLIIEAHPDDLAMVEEAAPGLVARLAASAHSETLARGDLTRGSIVVRTMEGMIDASIETQIERILDATLPDRRTRPVSDQSKEGHAIAESPTSTESASEPQTDASKQASDEASAPEQEGDSL